MEKNVYVAPEMEEMDIELEGMLCLSADGEIPSYGGEISGEGPEE